MTHLALAFLNAFAAAFNAAVYVAFGTYVNLGCAIFSGCVFLVSLVAWAKWSA